MPLQKLQFRPGLNREGTDYSNEGGWYDGDKIRFRSGFPEKIGGWTQVTPNQFDGTARSIWIWADGDAGAGASYIGVGTNTKYYIYFGGVYNDITPIIQTDTLSNPFATTNGSKTVTVTDGSYNPNVGDFVIYSGASAVGGLTIDGEYAVQSVINGSTYTITAAAFATSTATGGGTVVAQYEYPKGSNVYTIGTGWGAGPWGGPITPKTQALGVNPFASTNASSTVVVTQTAHGLSNGNYVAFSGATGFAGIPASMLNTTYQISGVTTNTYNITLPSSFTATATTSGGGSVTIALDQSGTRPWGSAYTSGIGQQLRLWSNDNYGADLVLAPRGGPIFYWQDNLSVYTRAQYLSLLANTTTEFTDSVTSFSSGATSITVGSAIAAQLYPYQYITGTGIPTGTYVSATYVTGSTTVPLTFKAPATATTANSSGTYSFTYAGAFVPTSTYQVITSSIQEFVIAFGANPYTPGVPSSTFSPLLVRWSDQGNAYQWIPELTNQSGEFLLTNGSYIMGARTQRQEILVWTDSCLYSMQYVGAPYVWGFQVLMDNISIISPNCMITINNVTYWMGRDRFYMYSGRVEVLPCALRQYIFDDINQDQSYQVFAGANEAFNEVWWYYVSNSSSGTSVDRYVIFNYLDRVWYYGTMARSAWMQNGIQQFPIAADYNGRLLYHENGTDDQSTANPIAIDAYVQSSDFDIGDGHNFGFVWRILPDVNFNGSTTNQPSVTMTIKPRQNSGTPYGQADNPQVQSAQNYTTIPAYTIQEFDGQVYTRLRGRQMAFRIESTGLGVAWQLGSPRIDIRPDGRR
jgi:hypothetical protein